MKKVKILSHSFTGKSLVVVYQDDKGVHTKIVEQSHVNWPSILAAYKKGLYDELVPLLDITGLINIKSNGKFEVRDGAVYYNGQVMSGYMFEQILFYLREFPKQYPRLVKFAENLFKNPSEKARNELYQFLMNGNMPITEDGCFLAYKGVTSDLWSKTSGSLVLLQGMTKPDGSSERTFIYNGVGEVIQVKREDVDPNCNVHCSIGLHVGSFKYANEFKGHGALIIVKVNPKDACTVPSDDAGKLRVCEYEVIAVNGEEGAKTKPLSNRRDINYDKAAKVRYHSRRGPDGKFLAANSPLRGPDGKFVSKS